MTATLTPRSHPVAVPSAERSLLASVVLAALATTVMVGAMRVFVSYMVFVIDQANRGTLAAVAVGVFLGVGLGGPLIRVIGPQRALLGTAEALVLARLLLQFWNAPVPRLVLGAAVIIAWGWLTLSLITRDRRAVAFGLPMGLALDLGIRIARGTVDLPWLPGPGAHAVTVVLLLALLGSALAVGRAAPGAESAGAALPLLVVGPALALFHLQTGNLGVAETRLDFDLPGAGATLALGAIVGLVGSGLVANGSEHQPRMSTAAALAIALAAGLWLSWNTEGRALVAAGLVATVAASLPLVTAALLAPTRHERASLSADTAAFTGGMLLQVGIIFAYYTFSGRPELIWPAVLLLAAGAVAAAAPRLRLPSVDMPALPAVTLGLVGFLVLACGWSWLTAEDVAAGPPLGPEITVMTYNTQNGFSIDNHFALDALARTIEQANPDVVVLQEVSRGWLVSSGVDELRWFSHRLGMPYVFGTNADDGIWGNAILTRALILEVAHRQYTTTQNLKRGVIGVRLATERGDLWVFGTHLDDPTEAGQVRMTQVTELIDVWGGRTPALLLGDLNAEPDSEVLQALAAAGFVDLGEVLGPEAWTSEDHRRIDHILATTGIELRDIEILDSRASDHRPVVARLTILP
ncbi:endonuclease/exonuclease/phosphatase family protein [Sphaerobacter sp.]|uniref:endonuclease/exonuclease/phosphatase family protein n=1 Tax=Sphaerobacter sp. TaxID=2099654 RepID=UPI001D484A1A|nr:endonuclease/exonuclease/phosphatase family protein [Sphaerobacter sp.]MBX5446722.1 endonuclease/exonuclease/phosphatase family protein [Sphaerobacter sp.]